MGRGDTEDPTKPLSKTQITHRVHNIRNFRDRSTPRQRKTERDQDPHGRTPEFEEAQIIWKRRQKTKVSMQSQRYFTIQKLMKIFPQIQSPTIDWGEKESRREKKPRPRGGEGRTETLRGRRSKKTEHAIPRELDLPRRIECLRLHGKSSTQPQRRERERRRLQLV